MIGMDEKKFIRTADAESIALLKSAGYRVISQSGDTYTFLNNGTTVFAGLRGVEYTNILHM